MDSVVASRSRRLPRPPPERASSSRRGPQAATPKASLLFGRDLLQLDGWLAPADALQDATRGPPSREDKAVGEHADRGHADCEENDRDGGNARPPGLAVGEEEAGYPVPRLGVEGAERPADQERRAVGGGDPGRQHHRRDAHESDPQLARRLRLEGEHEGEGDEEAVQGSGQPPAHDGPGGEEVLVTDRLRVHDGVFDGVRERAQEDGPVPEDHVNGVGRVAPRGVVVVHHPRLQSARGHRVLVVDPLHGCREQHHRTHRVREQKRPHLPPLGGAERGGLRRQVRLGPPDPHRHVRGADHADVVDTVADGERHEPHMPLDEPGDERLLVD
eukprot:scaffold14497_cov116-Isochrysis_galbana.AAC.2